jgi:hypothetical protein
MYELVMKVDYTANSLLAAVYKGPYRIMNSDKGGARLRDIKTGEEQSVSFEHMRKIKIDELPTLLPQNFDAEINKVLDKYRYKKGVMDDGNTNVDNKEEEEQTRRTLRSGKLFNIGFSDLSGRTAGEAEAVYWRAEKMLRRERINPETPILIGHSASEREFDFEREQEINSIGRRREKGESFRRKADQSEWEKYKINKTSSFSAGSEGTMIIRMKKAGHERPGSRVKFKEIIVHFY